MGDGQRRDLAAEWRERIAARANEAPEPEPQEVRLPSGLTVRAKRMLIADLMRRGRIPDAATPIVQAWIRAAKGKEPVEAVEAINAVVEQRRQEFAELVTAVWLGCVVEPRFTDDPAEAATGAALPIQEVDGEDAVAFLGWAQGLRPWWGDGERPGDAEGADGGDPVAAVAAFRDRRPAEPVGVAPGRPGVRARPAGDGRGRPGQLGRVADPPGGPSLRRVGGRPPRRDGAGAGDGVAPTANG